MEKLPRWLFIQNRKDWLPPVIWHGGKCPVSEGQKVSVWRGRFFKAGEQDWVKWDQWNGCWCCLAKPERHDWSSTPADGSYPIRLYRLPKGSAIVPVIPTDETRLRQIVREEIENVFLEMMGRVNG